MNFPDFAGSCRRLLLAATGLAFFQTAALADPPTRIDIQLVDVGSNTLEVQIIPDLNWTPPGVFGNLVFTLRWSDAANITIGNPTQFAYPPPFCAFQTNTVSASPLGVVNSGGFNYQNYTALDGTLPNDNSCNWTAGVAIPWVRIPYTPNDPEGPCPEFVIVQSDAYTSANNQDYFVGINGLELLGDVLGTGVEGPAGCGGGGPVDCEGVPDGPAIPGTPCDDGDPNTGGDTWDGDCNCVGLLIDCEGVPGGIALPGTACDDGDPNTGNDTYDANCVCAGQLIDCEGVPGGIALPGTACDDGDPNTGNDTYDANCVCAGQLIDCEGVPGGSALPGTACDDGDPNTGNDTYDANCVCAGQLIDCEGVPGGSALPGTACDDGDPNTGNDTYDANCVCAGQLIDCLGVPGGSALPGTACDDGDPNTINDTYGNDCICAGTPLPPVDCEGVPGGSALPGTACDDGDATTGNDTWDANCICVGELIDCEGVAGGSALPGTACDDGDATTINDVYDANCNCAGTPLAADCEGTPGGSALPGTPCDDGDATTGNDTWDANCICVGELIDCAGVAGGSDLPGTACNDGNPLTINDTWDIDCICVGTPIGDCTELLTLDITLDNSGSETTWEVLSDDGLTVIASGGPYADGQAGAVITETICLNQLCYSLVVSDAGNNGISGGGYVLTDASGRRIVDADGQFGGTSAMSAFTPNFCLPLSSQSLIAAWCDKTDLPNISSTQIYASFQPGATGYQFWIFDPHGSYTRRVFRTTQNLVVNNLVTLPVPADIDLNVRVRALIGGSYTGFGQACVIRLNTVNAMQASLRTDLVEAAEVMLYPNPNRGGDVFLRIDGIAPVEQRVDIDVYDLFGKRVFAEQVTVAGETFNHVLRLSDDLAMGMYMVNVRIGDKLYTERMVRH